MLLSQSGREVEPSCFLGRHKSCLLEQFYGQSLECDCECHEHQAPWSFSGP
jgi:hypothetical protein